MAEKSFGLKEINMIGVGTPAIRSSDDLIVGAAGTEQTLSINSGGVVVGTGFSVSVNDGYFGLGYGSSIGNSREKSTITSNITNELVLGVGNTDVVRVRPRSLWINRTGAQGGNRDLGIPSTLVVQGSAWGSSTREPWVQLITDKSSDDIGANASLGRIMFSTNGSGITNSTISGAWISCESRQSWTSNPSFYPADLIFWTNPGQSTPDKAVGITSEGNIRIYKAGAGIDFSATDDNETTGATTTSELLDDYEEGTFTPYLSGFSSGSVTYNIQTGNYVKIGTLVYIQVHIGIGAETISGGAIELDGLPFPFKDSNADRGGLNIHYAENIFTGVTMYYVSLRAESNVTRARFNYADATDGQINSTLSGANINGGSIFITGTYHVS